MRTLIIISLFLACTSSKALGIDDSLSSKKSSTISIPAELPKEYCRNVIGILNPVTNCNENYIFDPSLYRLRVDTLPQIRFWRGVMNTDKDSAYICVAHSRDIIQKVHVRDWDLKSDSLKKWYRDSVKMARNLDSSCRILVTAGKKFFYDFNKTSVNFQKGIHCFIDNGVDPWYAQAILLIESPNKLQKSNVGAYGSFQLMKDVAKMYGLKVNRQVDERADFERSAYAASSLLKYICIPRARRMLDSLKICNYSEEDLWFRLLVMHVYHAGAYNVQKALFSFSPTQGNMDLIYTLWRTQTARFKSASQNYSQLVIAAMLEMNERTPYLMRSDLLPEPQQNANAESEASNNRVGK